MNEKRRNSGIFTRHVLRLAAFLLLLACGSKPSSANAQLLYWDINNATAGASNTDAATGTWNATNTNWSTSADGDVATGVWDPLANAVFSAGTNATGASTITAGGTTASPFVVAGVTIEEGTVVFNTGVIGIGTGMITVESGAVLQTNSAARFAMDAGSSYVLNGGTLRTTNAGANGSFVDIEATIVLNGGGTIDYNVPDVLNIIQTNVAISGTGPLTKTGVGVLAISSEATYSGETIINNGELRIRNTHNRLPAATEVTVNSLGILNLNGLDQQIAALSGNGQVGLAGGRLTVSGDTSTSFSGTLEDIANAGAGGATTGAGRLSKAGSSTLTLDGSSPNTYSGVTTVSSGILALNKPVDVNAIAGAITIGAGTLRLDQDHQIADTSVLTMSTAGGVFDMTGRTETVGNVIGSSAFAQVLLGTGDLTIAPTAASQLFAGQMVGEAGSTLTMAGTGSGEFRASGSAQSLGFEKLILKGGLYRIGTGVTLGQDTQLGAVPVNYLADAITFDGGRLSFAGGTGTSTITLDANRGITLAAGGGTFQVDLSNAEIPGKITGVGSLTKTNGLKLTLSGANDYSGGTTVSAGTLAVDGATATLGTGDVTVAATLQLLNGATNSIADTATLTINGAGLVNIGDGIVEAIANLVIDGETKAFGTYGSTLSDATFKLDDFFSGTGMLSVGTAAVLTGDYNNDGMVDAADYVVWRDNVGGMTALPNDPVGGTIGDDQYVNWKANFGAPQPASGAGQSAAIPEPTTILLSVLALLGTFALCRNR